MLSCSFLLRKDTAGSLLRLHRQGSSARCMKSSLSYSLDKRSDMQIKRLGDEKLRRVARDKSNVSPARNPAHAVFDVSDPASMMSYNQGKRMSVQGAAQPWGASSTNVPSRSLKSVSSATFSTFAVNGEEETLADSANSFQTSASNEMDSGFADKKKGLLEEQNAFSTSTTKGRARTSSAEDDQVEHGEGPRRLRKWTPQLTKIVATVGPTSEQYPVMQQLVDSGMRVMRLNFSHATVDEVELRVKNLKVCKGRHAAVLPGRASHGNVRAILLDTRGPEIRTGKLRNDVTGKCTIQLQEGNKITLQTTNHWQEAGSTATDLYVDYANIAKFLHPDMKVLLDDGAVSLTVESTNVKNGSVDCIIDNSGELRSRAGVNLPGADTDMPAITEKDKADIKYGITKDVDFVAASFVQNAQGVHEIRQYMKHVLTNELDVEWDNEKAPTPLIISKIESASALKNFYEILEASDGIMVARGDLGVEIPIQQITNVQKEIIAACNAAGKPVIVATQMLESMAKNPRPTRAEVADVSNAVYDGADAVMLSGETAKGTYPVESVQMMNEIIMGAEKFATARPDLSGALGKLSNYQRTDIEETKIRHFNSVAKATVTAVEEQQATAIIALTKKGAIAKHISSFRPSVPIVAFCPNEKLARQLMIYRGVHPVVGLTGISPHKRPAAAIKDAKSMGFIQEGDDVVIVTGESIEDLNNAVSMRVATVL